MYNISSTSNIMEFKMSKSLSFISLVIVLLFMGCSSTTVINPNTGEKMIIDNTLPGWVANPQLGIEDGIAAVGEAAYSKRSGIMTDEAVLSAEVSLAGLLGKKIDDYQQKIMSNSRVDNDEAYASTLKRGTRAVVDGIVIFGANRITRYQSTVTGILYVRVLMAPSVIMDNMSAIQKKLKEKYKTMGITQKAAEDMTKGILEEAKKEWSK